MAKDANIPEGYENVPASEMVKLRAAYELVYDIAAQLCVSCDSPVVRKAVFKTIEAREQEARREEQTKQNLSDNGWDANSSHDGVLELQRCIDKQAEEANDAMEAAVNLRDFLAEMPIACTDKTYSFNEYDVPAVLRDVRKLLDDGIEAAKKELRIAKRDVRVNNKAAIALAKLVARIV